MVEGTKKEKVPLSFGGYRKSVKSGDMGWISWCASGYHGKLQTNRNSSITHFVDWGSFNVTQLKQNINNKNGYSYIVFEINFIQSFIKVSSKALKRIVESPIPKKLETSIQVEKRPLKIGVTLKIHKSTSGRFGIGLVKC